MSPSRPGKPIPEKPTTVRPPAKVKTTPRLLAPPWTARQVLKFTGTLNDPNEPNTRMAFWVLAGPGGPVPTGGWAQVNQISRPRNKAFTMVEGYAPLSMDVPILFEGVTDYGQYERKKPSQYGPWTAAQIEDNIQVLEWMAGRGKLYQNKSHPAQGNPPEVQIASYPVGNNKPASNLVPPNFHSEGKGDLRWYVTNLQYDANPIRSAFADRMQQSVTVSVTEVVRVPGAPASVRNRQVGRGNSNGYKIFQTTHALDTIQKICKDHHLDQVSQWNQVVQFNHKRLKVRSYLHQFKPGVKIEIPNSLFNP